MNIKYLNRKHNKIIIFDLDGTLADISKRREVSSKPDGKIDWDKFYDPDNIKLDRPNYPVVEVAKHLWKDYRIIIFSGRSAGTQEATEQWLEKYNIFYDDIKMRPTSQLMKPDDVLKEEWLDELIEQEQEITDEWDDPSFAMHRIMCVFDDRDKVVKMWRRRGLKCFQVAEGNF